MHQNWCQLWGMELEVKTIPKQTKPSFTYRWHMLQQTQDINHVRENKESGNSSQQVPGSLNYSLPFWEITGVICKSLSWYLQSFTWKTQTPGYMLSLNLTNLPANLSLSIFRDKNNIKIMSVDACTLFLDK